MAPKTMLPMFQSKPVLVLKCSGCARELCNRGMLASLLADKDVKLYSTDLAPYHSLLPLDSQYSTEKCNCQIRDVVCKHCGDEVGYTVVLPCQKCLQAPNNGHLWIFYSAAVSVMKRQHFHRDEPLIWFNLLEDDYRNETEEESCLR